MTNKPGSLCPFCKCEMQTMLLTDPDTGFVVSAVVDCCNPDCPRDTMDAQERQQAWDDFMRSNG